MGFGGELVHLCACCQHAFTCTGLSAGLPLLNAFGHATLPSVHARAFAGVRIIACSLARSHILSLREVDAFVLVFSRSDVHFAVAQTSFVPLQAYTLVACN